MCLTGVDYFSTLGYQPGIAALAAGSLAPIATLVLVLLTLFGALPMYRRVALESPHGDGSISMLERLLSRWQGKLFVLALIGFAATGFVITITLSAADAAAHVVENPFAPAFLHGQEIWITLVLIALLGAVFLKGFGEAIGIAVLLVFVFIGLNVVVVGVGLVEVITHPTVIGDWWGALGTSHGNPVLMLAAAMLLFPKLALGLSGFETGVVVMPLVKGDPTDTARRPLGRIRNTRKLLSTAAIIMSVMLIGSSLVTTLLIPAAEFQEGGKAYGRALAYLAHSRLGDIFGTAYDVSTIFILWFAGSSAMAGLLNIVPRYLPRYGMAPDWSRATRPLVLIFTAIAFYITYVFKADVNAQGGAYATGVLALMTSATIAVTLSARRRQRRAEMWFFGAIAVIFVYTTVVNIVERPDGITIAGFFIATIVVVSLVSRVYRTTELRIDKVTLDEKARAFVKAAAQHGEVRIIAHRRAKGDATEYRAKERSQRFNHLIPETDPVLFLEVDVSDASDFTDEMVVHGLEVTGKRGDWFAVMRAEGPAVPNSIAAFLLYVREATGKIPHCYFTWTEGSPVTFIVKYLFLGEGDTAPVTHEILRRAEPDPYRRPAIHVGGEDTTTLRRAR
ncbi:MAG TPA: amino acid transporter [Deinococcales bacterium]|nr:amino acid transporter [Deinococcales bacterium]